MANDDMTIIAAITPQGRGGGRRPLLRALISAVLAEGKTCLALDADPQGALALWDQRVTEGREGLTIEAVPSTAALAQRIDRAYEDGTTDFVFIDTQGIGGAWIDEVAVQCDHIVIPRHAVHHRRRDHPPDACAGTRTSRSATDEPELLPKQPRRPLLRPHEAHQRGRSRVAAAIIRGVSPRCAPCCPSRTQFGDMDTNGLLHALGRTQARRAHPPHANQRTPLRRRSRGGPARFSTTSWEATMSRRRKVATDLRLGPRIHPPVRRLGAGGVRGRRIRGGTPSYTGPQGPRRGKGRSSQCVDRPNRSGRTRQPRLRP